MVSREVMEERIKIVLAEYFKAAREESEMTQKDYAKHLLISDRQWRNIENGECEPLASTLALFMLTLTEAGQKALLADLKEAFEFDISENS